MLFFGKKIKVEAAIHSDRSSMQSDLIAGFRKASLSKTPVLVFFHFKNTFESFINNLQELDIDLKILEEKSQLTVAYLQKILNNGFVVVVPPSLVQQLKELYQIEKLNIKNLEFSVPEIYPANGPDQQIENYCKSISKSGQLIFHTHLESVMLNAFGTNNIISILKSLGHKKGDVLKSKMLYGSIKSAQNKISYSSPGNKSADSEYDWFKINTELLKNLAANSD